MTTLAAWADELQTGLRPYFDARVKIALHPGAMTLDDLERYALEAPCLRLGVLAAPISEEQYPLVDVAAAVYVVVKDGKAGLPTTQLLSYASALLAVMQSVRLAPTDTQRLRNVQFRNLYSPDVGRHGVALGAVQFNQLVQLDPPTALVTTEPFAELTTTYNTADGLDAVTDDQQFPTE